MENQFSTAAKSNQSVLDTESSIGENSEATLSPPAFQLQAAPIQRDPEAGENDNAREVDWESSNTAVANIALIKQEWAALGDGNKHKLAYILATVEHECGFHSRREKKQIAANTPGQRELIRLQDRYWPSGFYGRGFVQLTWERNYQAMSSVVGEDLVENPDLALVPVNAAKITISGMINGTFTTRSLGDYFNSSGNDFVGARAIINGSDKAAEIADKARAHYSRLTSEDEGEAYYADYMNLYDYQQVLKDEGFLRGNVDGAGGPDTQQAVRAFKAKYNLPNPTSSRIDDACHDKMMELQTERIGTPGESIVQAPEEIWEENGESSENVARALAPGLPGNAETVKGMLGYLSLSQDNFAYYLVQQSSVDTLTGLDQELLQSLYTAMDNGWTTEEEYLAMGKVQLALNGRIALDEQAAAAEERQEQDRADAAALASAPSAVTLVLTGNVGGGDSPNNSADVAFVKGALREMDLITEQEYGSSDMAVLATVIARYQRRIFSNPEWADGIVEAGKTTEKRLVARIRGTAKSDADRMENVRAAEGGEETGPTPIDASGEQTAAELITAANGESEILGATLAPIISSRPQIVRDAFDQTNWLYTDNLGFYIVRNLNDGQLAQIPPDITRVMFESMQGGWTTDEEYTQMARLQPYYDSEAEFDEGGANPDSPEVQKRYVISDGAAWLRDDDFEPFEDRRSIPKWTEVVVARTETQGDSTFVYVTSVDGSREWGWTKFTNLYIQTWRAEDDREELEGISTSYYDMLAQHDPAETSQLTMLSGRAAKANIDTLYPNQNDPSYLDNGFRAKMEEMLEFWGQYGITADANAGLRHPLRSVVFNYSIAVRGARSEDIIHEANAVCTKYGVPIDWAHRNDAGDIDLAASRTAAGQMVSAFGLAGRAARGVRDFGGTISNHNHGKAVDLTLHFNFSGNKVISRNGISYTVNAANETPSNISNVRNTALSRMGADNWGITRALDDDTVHWSYTGR